MKTRVYAVEGQLVELMRAQKADSVVAMSKRQPRVAFGRCSMLDSTD